MADDERNLLAIQLAQIMTIASKKLTITDLEDELAKVDKDSLKAMVATTEKLEKKIEFRENAKGKKKQKPKLYTTRQEEFQRFWARLRNDNETLEEQKKLYTEIVTTRILREKEEQKAKDEAERILKNKVDENYQEETKLYAPNATLYNF